MVLMRDPARVMQPRVASVEECIGDKEHSLGKGWKEADKDNSEKAPKPFVRAYHALGEGYGDNGKLHTNDEAKALLKDIPEIKITATHLVSI
jgi:hypothetical protein